MNRYFATTRYYPVNDAQKLIFLNTCRTASECRHIAGCRGVLGSILSQDWPKLTRAGYRIVRQGKDPRGGPGRGQGRPRKEVPFKPVQIKVSEQTRQQTAQLYKISDGSQTLQEFTSSLVLNAKKKDLVQLLKGPSQPTGNLQLLVSEGASNHLKQMAEDLSKLPELGKVTKARLLAAIIEAVNCKSV